MPGGEAASASGHCHIHFAIDRVIEASLVVGDIWNLPGE